MLKESKDILNIDFPKIEILYYGVLNYINIETNEKRFYLTGATNDANLVAFLLHRKIEEENVKILDFDIECMLYESDMFSKLSKENLFVNKGNFLQKNISKNIYTDDDKICLFDIVKVIPKNIKRKNFKTKEQFEQSVNKRTTILANLLDSTTISNNPESLSKSTFFSCPIINSDEFKDEITEFLKSSFYSDFEESINIAIELKDCLSENIDDLNFENEECDSNIILETVLIPSLGERWKEQLDLLKYFKNRTDLKLTVSCIEINKTVQFDQENKENLFEFIEYCLIVAENNGIEKLTLSVIIRYFTDVYIDKSTPEKYVGACILNDHGIFGLSKKDIMMASLTCAETGKKLKQEKNVSYMSFDDLFQRLKKSENKIIH